MNDTGRWAVVGTLVLTVLGVLAMISPELMFSPTLVTGGDLGAHIYPLREFVDRLLPSGALAGWTQGWYAGMPLFYFYFPLPAFIVAAGAPIVGFEVAVKLMLALGPLSLPPAAYAVLRATGMSRTEAGAGAVIGSSYLLMHSYSIFGGNLLSNYIGEFSYSISFTLSLLYLAVVLKAGRTGQAAPLLAAFLLSLTALSHVLTTAAVIVVTLPLVFDHRYARTITSSWFLGFLFSAFWAFPFLARLPFSSGPPWAYEPALSEVLPLELLLLLPIAAVGAWRVAKLGRSAGLPLLLLPVLAVAVYAMPQSFIHRARLLPYGFFAIHALAGVAIGYGLAYAATQRSRLSIGAVTVAIWAIVGLNVARDPRQVQASVEKTLAGYTEAENWDEYKGIVDAVSALPPGRLFWEESMRTHKYGSALALTIMPYWSPDHPVLSGLWTESSGTYPFYLRLSRELGDTLALTGGRFAGTRSFDFDRGIDHARVLGGKYFLAFSDEVRKLADVHPDLRPAVAGESWAIYEVARADLVSVATRQPAVYSGSGFPKVALHWFDSVPSFEPWVVASGRMDWPRIDAQLDGIEDAERVQAAGAVVTDASFGPERISFKTNAVGVPHLVRVSFFPNWAAIGASGPYRAAPSFMVVVPTAEEVELVFVDTWVEWTGRGLTLLGLVLAMFTVGWSDNEQTGPRRRQAVPSYGRRR